jgi:hypothetical protein
MKLMLSSSRSSSGLAYPHPIRQYTKLHTTTLYRHTVSFTACCPLLSTTQISSSPPLLPLAFLFLLLFFSAYPCTSPSLSRSRSVSYLRSTGRRSGEVVPRSSLQYLIQHSKEILSVILSDFHNIRIESCNVIM